MGRSALGETSHAGKTSLPTTLSPRAPPEMSFRNGAMGSEGKGLDAEHE